ncbi:MAG: geranylgeranyl reductase family protein [Candidatus Lokiarchaeota archaeon]|nr:geranylgeranyl reductase family protein [Candidatus Lokiarchaeota archaeon]
MYDVVIIGAGPAGSTAARYLSKMGISTCLIDKDTFPRDKPCGGGFAREIVDEFPYLRAKERTYLKGVCKVGIIHSPNRRTALQGKVDMAVALRTDFDNALLNCAIDNGVELLLGKRAKRLNFSDSCVEVTTDDGNVTKGRVLLGCDGVSSLVARSTGLNTRWDSKDITACRVAEIPIDEDTITDLYGSEKRYHFFANLGGLPGYGWIFPKAETVNVGLGIVGKYAQGLPTIFRQFIKLLKKQELLISSADLSRARGALVPTGGTIENTVSNRCLLVGDSAGMVSPLTGGGIVYAMRAGRYAAVVLDKLLDDGRLAIEDLMKYQSLWKMDFGKEIPYQLLAQRIFTGPFTDVLFEIGKRDKKIQELVSNSMAESSEEIDIKALITRTVWVCIREAFSLRND